MTYEEENNELIEDIEYLKKSITQNEKLLVNLSTDNGRKIYYKAYLQLLENPSWKWTTGQNVRTYDDFLHMIKSDAEKDLVKERAKLKICENRLKAGKVTRATADFLEKNQVEQVSGRIYRGTTLGMIMQQLFVFFAFIILLSIVFGIISLFTS